MLKSYKNLNIIIGNIEEQDTQVIVNPTNAEMAWEDLTCNGAIGNKAGTEFWGDTEKAIKEGGNLKTNGVIFSEGYNTNADHILNIYPPFWQFADSKEANEQKLFECFAICFEICKREGKTESISFPLIGAGAFMYPIKTSYDQLIKVIDTCDVSMFKEIRLTFWKEDHYNACFEDRI